MLSFFYAFFSQLVWYLIIVTNIAEFNRLDLELKREFYTSFKEAMEELERCFSRLDSKYDQETINEMFRAVHSVKGNSHMVFLDSVAEVCHKLEDIADQIRQGDYLYTPAQGEFMTFVFARLEQLIAEAISLGSIPDIHVEILLKGVSHVYDASLSTRDSVIQTTLESFSGILTNSEDESEQVLKRLAQQGSGAVQASVPELNQSFDGLAFMASVAQRVSSQSIQQPGDQEKLLSLCLWLNDRLGSVVDEDQLRAAFYFQVLGARFVSSPVFDIALRSASWEKKKALEQLELSAGFLKLSNQWDEAAKIVLQSYERYDGLGPLGLKGDEINQGSMIIALIRYYQQCYFKLKKDHKIKIAVSKSLSRINSEKNYRFSPEIVLLFNQMVHSDVLGVSL